MLPAVLADNWRNKPMKPVVLVVEDEASLVTMLRYNLEKEGYRVT